MWKDELVSMLVKRCKKLEEENSRLRAKAKEGENALLTNESTGGTI